MPKYYCDYCKSYLTHDKMSVRKSHLSGKNHIKNYCVYYEEKARQVGIWDTDDFPYEVDQNYIGLFALSPESFSRRFLRQNKSFVKQDDEDDQEICLPPPPNLSTLPPPPPSALRHTSEYSKSVATHVALASHEF